MSFPILFYCKYLLLFFFKWKDHDKKGVGAPIMISRGRKKDCFPLLAKKTQNFDEEFDSRSQARRNMTSILHKFNIPKHKDMGESNINREPLVIQEYACDTQGSIRWQ